MEKGPLNFTSQRMWTAPQAAGWGGPGAERRSGVLHAFSVSTLRANSGKSCSSPLKWRRTILVVI